MGLKVAGIQESNSETGMCTEQRVDHTLAVYPPDSLIPD